MTAADAGQTIFTTNASAVDIALPEAPAVGITYLIGQLGAGKVTISKTGGDVINGAASVSIANQWSGATLIHYTSGKWIAIGDLD